MADNVLINFTSDTSGLKDAADDLQFITHLDEALQKQVQKTAEEFKKQDAAINQSAKGFASNIGALSSSFANLTKVQIGDVLNKSLASVSKQAGLTGKDLANFYASIKKEANARILGGNAGKDLEALQQVIVQADKALKSLGATEDQVTEKTKSSRAMLRQMREELLQLEEAGRENTQQFEDLQISAGQLEDAIGDAGARIRALSSDTFVFDAIANGLQGVTGAFAIAQGATALFGAESEELNKALLKVQAALSIIQGLQSVINVLQKQSAASIGVDLLLRRNQAAATTAQAVAEGELTVAVTAETAATEGAAVATGVLNTVMNLNPAVLLVTTIAALAAGMYYFANSEDEAKENAETLNQALLDQLDIEQKLEKATNDYIAGSNRNLTNKLTYDQAAKKSRQELFKDEVAIAEQRSQFAEIDRQANMQGINNLEEYRKKYEEAGRSIEDLNKQLQADPSRKKQINEDKKSAQSLFELNKQLFDKYNAYDQEYFNSNRDLNAKRLEIETYTNEQALKSATAYADARVLLARAGTAQEFAARRAQLTAQEREELASVDLTEGERARIQAKYHKERADLDREQNIRTLQIVKAGIDDQVILAKESSKERLDFEIAAIEKQVEIDLAAAGLSEKEKARIRDAARASEREKIKAFNRQVAEDTVNSRIADINTQLDTLRVQGVKESDDKIIALKKQLIDEQGRLEIIGIEDSIKNEELRAAKIKEVYAKELLAKQQLEQDKQAAVTSKKFDPAEEFLQGQLDTINTVVAASGAGEAVKRAGHLMTYQIQKDLNQVQQNEDLERLKNREITQEQFDANQLERAKTLADKELQIKIDNVSRVKEIENQAADYTKQVVDLLFDNQQVQYQKELQANEDLYGKKLISEQEYNNRKNDIAKKQALAQKEKAIFDIAITLAKSIFEVQAQAAVLSSNPLTVPLAPIALKEIPKLIAGAVIQSAFVLARKYKKGKVLIDGPGSETSDSIPAMISRNESVINAQASRKHTEALRAINEHRFDQYLLDHEMPRLLDMIGGISVPTIPKGAERRMERQQAPAPIDYNKLGDVIAKKLRENPHLSISMDEDGFTKSIRQGIDTINIKDKKLYD